MYQIGSELSVPKAFFRHVGVYVGNGHVFHNHPVHGEKVAHLNEFSEGRTITVTKAGVTDQAGFMARFNSTMAAPKRYHLLHNNCEHTVSRLRTGQSKTPQVFLWGTTFVLGGIAIWAAAKTRK